jgi:hypothetical protein
MTRLWHPGRERRHAPHARAVVSILIISTVFTALAAAHAADPDLEFVYEVVDPSPPSGSGCCLDVCALGDINGDGDRDIVLSHSESSGRVSWFENPVWAEHAVETGTLVGAHSLEAVDFDRDGDFDVVTGEMHTSSQKRVFVYRNDGAGAAWTRLTLAVTGTHNVRVGDVTGDNKPDIVGKNYDGPKSVELWENSVALAVSVGPTGTPRFELGGNYPNPFSEDTSIPYHLVAAADVTLIVYGITGWKYATLVDGRKNAGGHVAAWNGRDRAGSKLRSGVYFYRMTSGGVTQTKKMVILR